MPADHPIRHAPGAVLAAHRAGTVREDLWELGRIAVNDLEALLQGLPPREMQPADPAIVFRLPVVGGSDLSNAQGSRVSFTASNEDQTFVARTRNP